MLKHNNCSMGLKSHTNTIDRKTLNTFFIQSLTQFELVLSQYTAGLGMEIFGCVPYLNKKDKRCSNTREVWHWMMVLHTPFRCTSFAWGPWQRMREKETYMHTHCISNGSSFEVPSSRASTNNDQFRLTLWYLFSLSALCFVCLASFCVFLFQFFLSCVWLAQSLDGHTVETVS